MAGKHARIIGTTTDAIKKAEKELGFSFPPSYQQWLLANNGLGVEGVNIFPVLDERDVRKTSDSIVREYRVNWLAWLENFEGEEIGFEHLLPFADFGACDYYCFDYSKFASEGEVPVVHWSHETGETENRGESFEDFLGKLKHGNFEFD